MELEIYCHNILMKFKKMTIFSYLMNVSTYSSTVLNNLYRCASNNSYCSMLIVLPFLIFSLPIGWPVLGYKGETPPLSVWMSSSSSVWYLLYIVFTVSARYIEIKFKQSAIEQLSTIDPSVFFQSRTSPLKLNIDLSVEYIQLKWFGAPRLISSTRWIGKYVII